jgi:hypothetical protein
MIREAISAVQCNDGPHDLSRVHALGCARVQQAAACVKSINNQSLIAHSESVTDGPLGIAHWSNI